MTEATRGHKFTESGAIVSCRDERMKHVNESVAKLSKHFQNAVDEKIHGLSCPRVSDISLFFRMSVSVSKSIFIFFCLDFVRYRET